MDGTTSLIGTRHRSLPPSPCFSRRPSPCPLPSLFLLSCSLPTTAPYRGVSLIARAELPEGETGPTADKGSTSSPPPTPPKKPGGKGTGFGGGLDAKKKQRGKERGSVIRRSPVKRSSMPYSGSKKEDQGQQSVNESAFLLTWLGLGFLILIEGVALAASGFLPEEWDNFFVKYLYPSFTPTVFLFVGGTVAYGVFKYLQGEQMKN
ncbi:protein LOW PSII ACCUMULATION 2, chloroplastic [Phoenix dactylifera]|uniref:Protein LOW PSII ACCUMULATION 2, chloroplastic n=1 Tax=Phoenix dactylifera TaxID=42345 RepID=A0A8B8ZH35_PHODC|nr:protein LOW PSII ACCUMULATION 2, chloroplastic [Phoenix dactylifera]